MAGAPRKSLIKIRDETEFYAHQTEGIRIMAKMGSFLLADEMGLGKTLQALTVAAIDWQIERAHRMIVVCPASLKWNWKQEIEEHTNFTCMVVNGTPAQRRDQITEFALLEMDILIVNYEQLIPHLAELNGLQFDIVIFDEAHYIKNWKSKRTQAALDLLAPRSFMLTGSPILNQVNDLWPILHRIDSERYPDYWRFINRYAVYGGFKNKQIVGIKHKDELNADLAAYMIRRMKKDVLDLPEKQYIPVLVDLHPEQAKLYKQADEELRITLPDSPDPLELENALTKMLRLKQICGTTATIIPEMDHSHKLDRATEMVLEITGSGHHIVVFTQFRAVQEAFVNRLEAEKVLCYTLNGDTPMPDRSSIVQAWGAATRPAVMVAMIQVAGVGLNMTQASHCIFLDKVWAPKINEQAEDRLHRIGASSTEAIQIYTMLCRGTVEDRVERILKRKKKLFNDVVETSDWKRALYAAMREDDDE